MVVHEIEKSVDPDHFVPIFEAMPTACLIVKANKPVYTIVTVNAAYESLTNVKRETICGRSFPVVVADYGQHVVPWEETFDQLLAATPHGAFVSPKYLFTLPATASQPEKVLEIAHTPIFDQHGDVQYILKTLVEVTDQLRGRYSQALVDSINGIVWEADVETFEFLFVSRQVEKILGYTSEQWLSEPGFWKNHMHPEDRAAIPDTCPKLLEEDANHKFDYRMLRPDGKVVWIRDLVTIIREDGKPVLFRGFMTDISENKRLEDLERLERDILALNSDSNAQVAAVLNAYLLGVERIFPEMKCSIMAIRDNRLRNWASPSLSKTYLDSIEGILIGENAGSCGTAAYLKERVVVTDIVNDPRWEGYHELAVSNNLHACWSHPIILADGSVIATFAVYYEETRSPNPEELRFLDRSVALLKVVLENRKNAELAEAVTVDLRKSNERHELLNHATNDAIYDWDLLQDHIEWGDGYQRLFGLARDLDNYPKARWLDHLHEADKVPTQQSLALHLGNKTQTRWSAKYRFRKADGSYAFVEEIGYIRRNASGQPERMVGVLRDISRQKQEETELRMLGSVITNTNDAVVIARSHSADPLDLQILYVNAAFAKITGYHSTEVLGKSPLSLRGFNTRYNNFRKLREAISLSESLKADNLHYFRDDHEYFINLSAHPVFDELGKLTHWIFIGRDVTDKRRYVREIEDRNKKLEEIAWLQSHVIRAPLARVMSIVDLLLNYENSPEEQEDLLRRILSSANDLDDIIHDISGKAERV